MSMEEEFMMKAGEFQRKRETLGKCVDVMWKYGATEEPGDIKISKDVELWQKAGEMEQKRKIAGEWLAKFKETEEQENNISY